jgi:methyl-accepting chemotaxis protein
MKLTLGKKLGFGFGLILGLLVFSSAMTYLKSMKTAQSEASAFEVRFPSLKAAIKLQRDLNYTQVKGRQAILAGTQQSRRDEAKKAFDGAWSAVGQDLAELDKLASRWSAQADEDRLNGVKEQLPTLRAVQESVIVLAASGENRCGGEGGERIRRPDNS